MVLDNETEETPQSNIIWMYRPRYYLDPVTGLEMAEYIPVDAAQYLASLVLETPKTEMLPARPDFKTSLSTFIVKGILEHSQSVQYLDRDTPFNPKWPDGTIFDPKDESKEE